MSERPPAGWYSDPYGNGQRYWDGTQWTDHSLAHVDNAAVPSPPSAQDSNRVYIPGPWVIAGVVLALLIVVISALSLLGSGEPRPVAQTASAAQQVSRATIERPRNGQVVRNETVLVEGKATDAARVNLFNTDSSDSIDAEVGPDGRYSARVLLRRGDNEIEVSVVSGRYKETTGDRIRVVRELSAAERAKARRSREKKRAAREARAERRRDERAERDEAKATTPPTASTSEFSGNGSKNLGNITVSEDSELTWTHSEGGDLAFFTVSDDTFEIGVSSDATSGSTAVARGTYKNVHVNATGDWTVSISPG